MRKSNVKNDLASMLTPDWRMAWGSKRNATTVGLSHPRWYTFDANKIIDITVCAIEDLPLGSNELADYMLMEKFVVIIQVTFYEGDRFYLGYRGPFNDQTALDHFLTLLRSDAHKMTLQQQTNVSTKLAYGSQNMPD